MNEFVNTPVTVKLKAHQIALKAVRTGILSEQPCVKCGADNALKHHEDYSKPLEVVWLCPKCHAARHKELRKIHGIVIVGYGCRRRYVQLAAVKLAA